MEVLFVCDHNEGRSQIAEAFFKRFSKKNICASAGINAHSAGMKLKDSNPRVVVFMKELDFDLSSCIIKQLDKEAIAKADLIIVMSDNMLPDFLSNSKKVRIWDVKDFASDLEAYRVLRDKIKHNVELLVKEIG